MAANTFFDVGNALFAMLGNDLGFLVFMTSVASVALVILQVAGHAGGIVSIEREIAVMGKAGWFPSVRLAA